MLRKPLKDSLAILALPLTLLLLLSSFACKTAPTAATPQAPPPIKNEEKQPATHVSAINETELENIEYHSVSAQKGAVTLHRGVFRNKISGKSKAEIITALSHSIAYGKLADKRDGAAAVLITMAGGTEAFHDLAVVLKRGGKPRNIATTFLGDRIQIKSLSIENGYIIVDMIKHKKKDPMCCPTQEVVQKYSLEGNKLVLVKSIQN
jgi:hypothetical protein